VALETALSNLCSSLRALYRVLDELRYTVTEDVPESGSVILVDQAGEAVTELLGLSKECMDAGEGAEKAGSQPYDPNKLRRLLTVSQTQFHHLAHIYTASLLSYEQVNALVQFGRRRGPEWAAWVTSVREGVEKCLPALEAAEDAYFQCWREMAERIIAGQVSVHTTNIGQQITREALESREIETGGVT
jgi:hypothetical protein